MNAIGRLILVSASVMILVLGPGVWFPSHAASIGSWDSIVAKAKKEGSVNVSGPGTASVRRAMTKPFQSRYGISVEYEGGRGSSHRNKILTQRRAGLFKIDLWISGFGSVTGLDIRKLFEPLESPMIHPEVKDPKKWLNGFLWHNANNRRFFAHSSRLYGGVAVNPQIVKGDEITSYQDLLKSKYKGKIISDDPRVAGAGQGLFTYLYMGKKFGFGPGFIKRLVEEQEIVFTRNIRQAADWLVNGRYTLLPAPNPRPIIELKSKGVPLEHRCLEDGQWLSVGGGGVGMLTRAPHPNAAVLYLNWLLGKEGQQLFSHAGDTSSRRLDVPSKIPSCFVPQSGKDYFWVDKAEALKTRRPGGELVKYLRSIYRRN